MNGRLIHYDLNSIADGVNFLAHLFHSGAGYSTVNAARSELSSIPSSSDGTTFGKNPFVSRLLKCVFERVLHYQNKRPSGTFLCLLKTTRPGKHLTNIRLDAFTDNKNLCPVEHLKPYPNNTSKFRGLHTQLFLSYQKKEIFLFRLVLYQLDENGDVKGCY